MQAITAPTSTARRHFLAAGSAASLAAPTILRAAARSDKLRLGLIGCGGRGTGAAAQALTADSNVELYAMGDVFQTQIANSQESLKKQFEKDPTRINVPAARQFTGLDAYQKVLQSGVDVVLLCTPGGFRPFHLRAAIEAGKHVFCEKPMAVDPAGIRSVLESTRLAKQKNLAIRAGFNFRFESPYRAALQRVQDGAIGDIVAIYSTRMSNRLARFDGLRTRSRELGEPLAAHAAEWRAGRAFRRAGRARGQSDDCGSARVLLARGRGTQEPSHVTPPPLVRACKHQSLQIRRGQTQATALAALDPPREVTRPAQRVSRAVEVANARV